jgi:hypothetical protein
MPNLTFTGDVKSATTAGVTFVVYAPFGTDAELSTYPNGTSKSVATHPLVLGLEQVAADGVNVCLLIDRVDDDTWLVDIPAGKSKVLSSRWKHDMQSPRTLAGLLRHAAQRYPSSALVLALEGHGAGYIPELDVSKLDVEHLTDGGAAGSIEWKIDKKKGAPLLPMGSPLLPMGSPLLPMGSPLLPVNHYPISSWGLAWALKAALPVAPRRLGVIHLNNCFNMSVELLHTIAPYADFATGYINYNFFTAGASYPMVSERLKIKGTASTAELARWFAEANRDGLAAVAHHPTVGAAVRLANMAKVATAIDALAKALIVALTGATSAARPLVVGKIRDAIRLAQQYDTVETQLLDAPDELTDIASLASRLRTFDVNAAQVQAAANAVLTAVAGVKIYGANDLPWTSPSTRWDFSRPDLAMNILCPDPTLIGLWDWRSPFYLQKTPQPAQPQVIDFLSRTAWVDFIIEYHRGVPFLGLRPAAIPRYPVFRRTTI